MTQSNYQELENRSIFSSIKIIFSSAANAMVGLTSAVGKVSLISESLAETGLVMADSNRTLVTLETQGKELEKLKDLQERFPNLEIKLEDK